MNKLSLYGSSEEEFEEELIYQGKMMGIWSVSADQILQAMSYLGIDPADFTLKNAMFRRPIHAPIHGIGHIYRTMIGCALLGELLQKPRAGLLAFCGAYIHDLARITDGVEPEHGARAVKEYFGAFSDLWDNIRVLQSVFGIRIIN